MVPRKRSFFRPAGDALARVDELHESSVLSPVGHVAGYWRWRGVAPCSAVKRAVSGADLERSATLRVQCEVRFH